MGGKSDAKAGGFLAPKAIANRIKAKGLTKLRWCAAARHPQSWEHRALRGAPQLRVLGDVQQPATQPQGR